jgi:hypothetical protein
MRALNVAPRYIVPQNTPTPTLHMMVAMSVAYGIRVIQFLQLLPINKAISKNKSIKWGIKVLYNLFFMHLPPPYCPK